MHKYIERLVGSFLNRIGISITYSDKMLALNKAADTSRKFEILSYFNQDKEITVSEARDLFSKAKSQIGQDVFAIAANHFKRNGFFVEFGATNGLELSNTWILEKEFGWKGILAEPAKIWHQKLSESRTADISHDCVWIKTGDSLRFLESSELSSLAKYSKNDFHSKRRKNAIEYFVTTITLGDLLRSYNAPKVIDFLSIDTEGSEFDILFTFNFEEYDVLSICVEHNFTENREKIHSLLSSKGYKRVLNEISLFDDWYVLDSKS